MTQDLATVMFAQLALVVAAGLLGPLLAAGRRPLAPVLVGELIAGAILGRTGFGIVDPGAQPLPAFNALGFAMLMLGAGTEVDLRSPQLRQGIARGGLALVVAVAASIPLALLLANGCIWATPSSSRCCWRGARPRWRSRPCRSAGWPGRPFPFSSRGSPWLTRLPPS